MAHRARPAALAAALTVAVLLAVDPCPARAQDRLASSGFAVEPGTSADFVSAYDAAVAAGDPVFITTDSALALTRSVLEETLLRVEGGALYDRLTELSRALVRLSEDQYLEAVEPAAREAARRNIAYFAVPLSLLDPDYFPPESARGLVERELDLIERGEGITLSPIMGPTPLDGVVGPGEDYSAYRPAGRAAGDERLGRFHRAVTWYSRMAFALPEGRVLDYGLTMQALLAAQAVQREAGDWLEAWERVHDPLRFYLGGSGDPTIADYAEVAAEVFGEGFGVDDVADQSRLETFAALVGKAAPPHFDTHELRGMRFLARPTLPDTRYFVRLSGSPETPLPAGLDLAGLLGSSWARSALEERDAFASDLYRRGFEEIVRELESMTYGQWTTDVATSWLYALESLADAPPPPPGSIPATAAPLWGAKQASTIAAGWALVRRAPVGLSAAAASPEPAGVVERQAADGGPAAADPEAATPLVEPYPVLYGRLRELVEHARDRLWENYLLDDSLESLLAGHRDFLASLEARAAGEQGRGVRRDARGPALPSQHARSLAAGLSWNGAPPVPEEFVATVFTDLVSGRVLSAGVGGPDRILVATRERSGDAVYCGAVFSYRESGAGPVLGRGAQRAVAEAEPGDRPWWALDLVGDGDEGGGRR
jgi:hypothetical protein